MVLRVDESFHKTGLLLSGSANTLTYAGGYATAFQGITLPWDDPLTHYVAHGENVYRPLSILNLFSGFRGVGFREGDACLAVQGRKPTSDRFECELNSHNAIYAAIDLLMDGFKKPLVHIGNIPSHEHEISHLNVKGICRVVGKNGSMYRSHVNGEIIGFNDIAESFTTDFDADGQPVGVNPTGWRDPPGYLLYNLKGLYDAGMLSASELDTKECKYSSIEAEFDGDFLVSLSYVLDTYHENTKYLHHYTYHVTIECSMETSSFVAPTTNVLHLQNDVGWEYQLTHKYHQVWHDRTTKSTGAVAGGSTDSWATQVIARSPFFTGTFGEAVDPIEAAEQLLWKAPYIVTERTLEKEFRSFYEEYVYDLHASTFFSAKDAVDQHLAVLEANHLETLSEMKDLLSVVEGISSLMGLVRNLKRGKLPKFPNRRPKVREVLNLLTNAELLYRFGIAPTVSDGQELADVVKSGEFVNHFESVYGEHTVNGKFIFPFPAGTTPFDGAYLVSRSKVRVHVGQSTVVSLLLGANAVGVLPTLSRLWDLVPFSFVVDWVLNLGGRLENIDSQVLMLALDTKYFVNSFEVVVPISGIHLRTHGFESTGSETSSEYPTMRWYTRTVSSLPPRLRDARFDYSPAHAAKPQTVGSLAYQVSKSTKR